MKVRNWAVVVLIIVIGVLVLFTRNIIDNILLVGLYIYHLHNRFIYLNKYSINTLESTLLYITEVFAFIVSVSLVALIFDFAGPLGSDLSVFVALLIFINIDFLFWIRTKSDFDINKHVKYINLIIVFIFVTFIELSSTMPSLIIKFGYDQLNQDLLAFSSWMFKSLGVINGAIQFLLIKRIDKAGTIITK